MILNFVECPQSCVEKMNGRMYAGRKIIAALWDGYTNHVKKESEEERKQREQEFGAWLEAKSSTTTTAAADVSSAKEDEETHSKDEPQETSSSTNILEEYTEKIMNFLMSPECKLSEDTQDKISEKLDEAAEWMIENRSLLHDAASLRKKKKELEDAINPMMM